LERRKHHPAWWRFPARAGWCRSWRFSFGVEIHWFRYDSNNGAGDQVSGKENGRSHSVGADHSCCRLYDHHCSHRWFGSTSTDRWTQCPEPELVTQLDMLAVFGYLAIAAGVLYAFTTLMGFWTSSARVLYGASQ